MWLKEACKGGPKWPNKGKAHGPKSTPKRCIEEASGPGQTGATTGCPWGPPRPVVGGARPCALPRTAVRPLGCLGFSVFAWLFVFLCVFLLFCLYTQFTVIHSPFISISIRVVFRERKRERRITARILDRVLRSKDGRAVLDEQFFPFSSLILI